MPAELVDAVVLAVSEAATTAILYGSSGTQPVKVTVQVRGGWIEATIRDWGRAADAPRTVPESSLGGRGLWLLAQLADELHLAKAHPGTLVALRWRIGEAPVRREAPRTEGGARPPRWAVAAAW